MGEAVGPSIRGRAQPWSRCRGLRGYLHNKVAKRLEQGSEHSLFQFYWYALTKETLPGTNVRVMSDPAEPVAEEPPGKRSTG